MSPDLPEKLLGMSIDDPSDSRSRDDDSDETEELERFVFLAIGEQRLAIPVDDVKTITNPPTELTRVPRSPEAVEGVVDFRGEITAVIEPRIHFPVDGDRSTRQRLVVFDRPTDQQPAAIRVDDVIGVENVPASNVLEDADLEDIDGGALEHPLVVALVKQERTVGQRSSPVQEGAEEDAQQSAPTLELGGTNANTGSGSGSGPGPSERTPHTSLAAARTQTSEEFDAAVADDDASADVGAGGGQDQSETQATVSELDSGTESESTSDADSNSKPDPETVVETTPLVDVDRFLLASGYQE
ncbi:chemotaxis protein CheW [Halobacteria archaeon AArc-m2/3/4]|uniref:Chemotaxis protein CheW n=1 Tax=Natronoglomus mannanivorans TaxID=2979990 RepID=A0ABT2QA33_9EURY|nr:chemotaxis protein CheW [Halobacteria archaeon AArc-m2/3/4]